MGLSFESPVEKIKQCVMPAKIVTDRSYFKTFGYFIYIAIAAI
jgi:hypothetical protein